MEELVAGPGVCSRVVRGTGDLASLCNSYLVQLMA